jgi:TNF receptor-associated protein 1
MMTESCELNLYCRKVLIKAKCQELLPNYLRFVKGVVDCEDLPLNISRENYQDSSLMAKLRNVITRRVLKMLEDESKRDADKYNKWFGEFQNFIKEGLTVDAENSEPLFKLLRFNSSWAGNALISLDDYIAKMKPTQDKIYFVVG